MQSSKSILKRLVSVIKAPTLPFRPSVAFIPSSSFTFNSSTKFFAYKSTSSFSDTAKAIEETEHAHSEAHLLTEEFNLLMRSHHFNKSLVLHTLEKYMAYVSKAVDIASVEQVNSSHEFKQFCNYIISNLKEFKTPSEVANILIFLLNVSRNNQQALDSLAVFIKNYSQLMTMPASNLKVIMTSLFSVTDPDSQDFLHYFADQVRKNKGSYDINEYVVLLDCINELLSPTRDLNPGKKSGDFANLISSELNYLLEQANKLNAGNFVTLYEFIFEDEPNDKWTQLVQRIEGRILEDVSSLSADQITALVYIMNRLNRETHELWSLLEEEILVKLEEFSTNQLVSVLGAFSAMGKGSDDLFMEIDRRLGLFHHLIIPRDFAPMVYWFAHSEKYRKKFFYMALNSIIENISVYNAQDLIRILWAYTTTNTLTEPLYRILEQNLQHKVKVFEGEDLSLLFDCVTYLNDPNSSLFSLVFSGIKQTFGDAKGYKEIDEDLALKVYAVRSQGERSYDELLPSIDNYILYRLNEEVNSENVDFFIQVGNSFGENYDHAIKNPALLSVYQRKLGQVQQGKRDWLDEEQATEIDFLNVNLKGLAEANA